jgi:hypothetical protein
MYKYNQIINEINRYIDLLLFEQDNQEDNSDDDNVVSYKEDILDVKSDIEKLRADIERYKKSLMGDDDSYSFPYKRCRIEFKEKYELELPEYGLEDIKRTLEGEMYFNIVGGSVVDKTIYLQTTSLRESNFEIKISDFKKFKTFSKQKGDANLIYKRRYEGEKVEIKFEFTKLI